MVGSSTCNTAFAGTDHPDETLFDGRFIVKGNEYYISPTLSLRRNNIVVFESRPGCKYAVEGQMRPKEAGRDRSTSTIRISLAKQTGTMAVHMPFCQKSEVPLFAVARILGFKKRIELAWCIVSGGMLSGREGEGRLPRSDTQIYRDLSRKAKALVRIFKEDELAPPGRFTMPQVLPADRVVPDLEMSTERQIIQWMGRIVLPKQCIQKHTKLSEDEVRNAQIEKVLSLRRAEIFPNVGTLDNAGTHAVKRRLLAFFAWRVLMVKNKKCPPSDRDNFGLVELKTAGERTAAKITQAARKQVARVRNIRIAQYKGDRVGVPMPTLFSQTSFSRDIESAFATGNFADTRAADSMDGSGVSKPLPRKSDADTLSALRRLRHDVHSANKNTKPRQMNLSTAGFICPLNTTDSETTGIVLNFAMHTTIALGSPRVSILTPLRDAFPALFVTHFTGGAVYDASWKPTSYNERSEDAADAAIADALVRPDARATWIHVNGTPVGISMAPLDALARAARVARRRGIIPRMVDVVESPETQSLYLSDTMGSPRRPVVVTEDWGFKGSWRRIASVLARYGWGPTVTKPRSASIKRPRGTAATEKHGTRGPRRGMPRDIWDALLQTGCIEYISPAEQMVTYIRPNPCRTFAEELGFAGVMHAAEIPRPPPMTHADIHPILSYSETVILIILLETNKSCRGVFSSCMIRSAMKIAGETLSRGTQVALLRGDNPLVDSEGDDILGFGPKSGNARLSHGVNGITAVLPAKSRNQEDSLAMNRAAVELGFGATVTTNTYTATVSTEMFTLAGSTVLGIPPRDASGGRGGAFAAVEDDGDGDDDDVDRKKDKGIAETTGLPAVGDWLEPGDVVIARIGIPRTKEGGVVAAAIREGAIDLCGRERHAADLDPRLLKLLRDESVLVNQTDGLSQVTRVVVRETREPGKRSIVVQTQRVRSVELGRKFSSRQGQKGVVGGIINREDMPFLPDGTIPHFLFNPHGLPSRGTHAFMEECVTGVLAAVLGKAVRATPFHSFHPETIQRVLRRVQHSDSGSGPPLAFDPGAARLMNPDTGELLAPTTVGVIHYLAEPQTASDKRSARTTGPVSGFTRQPLRGRSNQGGQRVGWMGSLSLAASGAGAVLQDRITRSDPVYACVCSKCGLFARNRKTGASLVEAREVDVEPYCIGCKTGDYTGVVRVPYAWVVFSELLRSAGISTRLDVDMNVDGDDMGLPAPGFAAFRGYGQPWQTTLLKSHKTYVEAGSTARADTATATTPNSGQSRHRSGRRRQQRTLPVVRARSSSSSTLTADQGRSQILAAAKRRRGRWDAVASDEAAGLHISKSSATAVFDPTLAAAAAEFSAAPSASASALAAPNVADMYSSHFTDDGFVGDGGTDTMPPASPPFRLDGGTTEPTTYPEPYSPVDAAAIPPSDYGAAGGYTPYSPTSVVPDYSTRIYSPTSPYPATAQDDESRAFSPTEMDE
jgi:DNA-directed RNA polymerase beta subunit